MFLFITGIILVLSLGSVIFMLVRKIPVLVALPENISVSTKQKKPLFSRIKESGLARHKNLLSINNFKREKVGENKAERKQEFDEETDYWKKVMKR